MNRYMRHQFVHESELPEKRAENALLLHVDRFGWSWGIPAWLWITLLRSLSLLVLLLSRHKIGRSAYGEVSLLVGGFLFSFITVVDFSPEARDSTSLFMRCVYALPVWWNTLEHPVLFFEYNAPMAILTVVVLVLGIANKLTEHILLDAEKPGLFQRGKSNLLWLLDRLTGSANSAYTPGIAKRIAEMLRSTSNHIDSYGVYTRFLEPCLFLAAGYGCYRMAEAGHLYHGFLPVGTLLMISSLCLMYGDIVIFNRGRKTR